MENLDDSENNAKISDSAYSNSCSNSQSRRSHSSKSTRSGSNSSRSSGYGGKPSTSGYSSNNTNIPPEKRHKEKESKKKKRTHTKCSKTESKPKEVKIPPKCISPEPVKECDVPQEEEIVVSLTLPAPDTLSEKASEIMDISSPERASCKDETESGKTQLVKFTGNEFDRPCSFECPDSFTCVISMHDGVVMYTTSNITTMLGYPKDMWIGRSFLDFIHQRDRNIFASQITIGLAMPKTVDMQPKVVPQVNTSSSMVCRLRRYRSLACGFGVKNKAVAFMPFLLKLSFKKLNDDDDCVYLAIKATPFFSGYQIPHEIIPEAVPFIIRHSANGNMEYVDPEAVPYLGYLPQDLVDKNILQMYHPHDLDYLQHIYETIVREGSMPRSSPYRIMIQNGDFIKLETEWTSFINPWSRKLEFVIGKHHVVEGPRNPNVFAPPDVAMMFRLNEDDKARTQCMRDNIVRIMNEGLTKPAEAAKQLMTKRCQDLAAYMETLLEDTPKPQNAVNIQDDYCYYERDSIILGGISPHRDYNDCKTGIDAPLSYNQLNYNDNLQRFFDSHVPYDSEETDTMNDDKLNDAQNNEQETVTEKSLSPFTLSSASSRHDVRVRRSRGLVSNSSVLIVDQVYTPVRLTESLLHKHNIEMEKELMKIHRETRYCTRSERERALIQNRQKKKEHLARCNATFQPTSAGLMIFDEQPHGVKRASRTCEVETVKTRKQQCTSRRQSRRWHAAGASGVHSASMSSNNANIWPPVSQSESKNKFVLGVGLPQQIPIVTPATVPGYYPLYYARHPVSAVHPESPSTSQERHQNPSTQCMVYGQAMYGSPYLYAPIGPQVSYSTQQTYLNQINQINHNRPSNQTHRSHPKHQTHHNHSNHQTHHIHANHQIHHNHHSHHYHPNHQINHNHHSHQNHRNHLNHATYQHHPNQLTDQSHSTNLSRPTNPSCSTSPSRSFNPCRSNNPSHPANPSHTTNTSRSPNPIRPTNPSPPTNPSHPTNPGRLSIESYQHAYPIELDRRNFEEACKPSFPVKSKPFSESLWRLRKRSLLDRKIRSRGSASSSSAENYKKNAFKRASNNDDIHDRTDGESSSSSFYSSFFKTESGSGEDSDNRKSSRRSSKLRTKSWTKVSQGDDTRYSSDERYGYTKEVRYVPKRKMDAPWMESVNVTSELTHKYQVVRKNMEEVLAGDKKRMTTMEQPPLVNEQLNQLYLDLQLQGVAARLALEEGVTSSSSSGEESTPRPRPRYVRRRKRDHSRLVMIYEENANLPPPAESPYLSPVY